MGSQELRKTFERAKDSNNAEESVSLYEGILLSDSPNDAENVKVKEEAIEKLTELKIGQNDAQYLAALLKQLRRLFTKLPKAKTAKIVRNIIDAIAKIPGSTDIQLAVCKEQVEWAKQEKRTFLRQRIEARLANLYLDTKEYADALTLISRLLTEVKKLDDKLLLVDIHLLESRVHLALRNLPKAKAALTAARTAANSIYVPPSLQAEIDLQSGIIHAEEKDYKTSYSYFLEAFEALNALEDRKAATALKYMLLTKIMTRDSKDTAAITSTINEKAGLKYAGPDVDAMQAVAKAYQDRSVKEFSVILEKYRKELVEDPIIHVHLLRLWETLVEQNLCKLIEPYSRVEIAHVAKLINLSVDEVVTKLSQMILDKKFAGTLDQGSGCLEVFEDSREQDLYPNALTVIDSMSNVVDTLYLRSQKLLA